MNLPTVEFTLKDYEDLLKKLQEKYAKSFQKQLRIIVNRHLLKYPEHSISPRIQRQMK